MDILDKKRISITGELQFGVLIDYLNRRAGGGFLTIRIPFITITILLGDE